MAVWAWNAALALVCGNTLVWKPSEKALLCAKACHEALLDAANMSELRIPVEAVINGRAPTGEALARNARVPLVSATGSTPMGRSVAKTVAQRLGRSLLELGGNNAMIVAPSADLDLAVVAATFSAIGTCGQRCTTLRRLFVHVDVYDSFVAKLSEAYASIKVGDPRDPNVHVGPIIDKRGIESMTNASNAAIEQGGKLLCSAPVGDQVPGGTYVVPAVFEMPEHSKIVDCETFAPILYVMKYTELSFAIALNNRVSQGLSSTIMTNDIREAERFCSAAGSDCGIANVNIGTSGAEIGGAFGGEKDTGGGRESGSDAWKSYMRRQTNTVNYGSELPLAQGIKFKIT
jgi:aldehyde dehydrogenase (NAD+)